MNLKKVSDEKCTFQIPEAIQDSLLLKSLLSSKSLTGIWEDFVVPNELGDDVK